ncbi:MAG: DUF4105 domain-containing protein [Pseudolabrys sp.]|nr:DUF4105 domain-containing protein [Pseudolabrys sp.]
MHWRAILLLVITVPATALMLTALWFQADPPWRWLWMALVAAAAIAIGIAGIRRPKAGWGGLAVAILIGVVWWSSIKPSNDRVWAADVAHGVSAGINGGYGVLHNVRNFDWKTETQAVERWETRRYALDKLTSVDLVSSVWSSPAIAHTLISFGFSDGQHVVFSAEVRREKGEEFSEVGGFFKQFELVMIAADEADIIKLRTNIRKEDVTLLPLKVTAAQARDLFLGFAERANKLAGEAEWYQTITTNCTTVIFELARHIDNRVPLDWRILLSGYLPGYLYELGIIRTDIPLAQVLQNVAISKKAQALQPTADYSRGIRN